MLRVLDLFSGIGGFSLGLERTGGFETAAFCEYAEWPRKVLAKHWPNVPIFEDVRTLKGTDIDGRRYLRRIPLPALFHSRATEGQGR
jgi:DNA (cytosine-5)-methyltransferase 1